MARIWWIPLIFTGLLCAQSTQDKDQQKQPQLKSRNQKTDGSTAPKADAAQPQEPPEEDDAQKPAQEYAFNPVRAQYELGTGNFYFKKGNYRAAALRFREAGKWNPGYAEAYLRLGEAAEKLKDNAMEREAYGKYLEISPDAKNADTVKKKLASLR